MKTFGFDLNDAFFYENGFYLTSHPKRMGKLLAQYELYKKIVNLPGEVIECGVFKGASFMRLASFRHLFESEDSRRLIAFDAFGKFPIQGDEEDRLFIQAFEDEAGDGIPCESLVKLLADKGFSNYELIAGDINETVPEYVRTHPALKIALLHIDVDIYCPTKTILENFYPRMVKGGIVMLDDYGKVAGETKAVDEYFGGYDVKIEKPAWCHIPSYIVVE